MTLPASTLPRHTFPFPRPLRLSLLSRSLTSKPRPSTHNVIAPPPAAKPASSAPPSPSGDQTPPRPSHPLPPIKPSSPLGFNLSRFVKSLTSIGVEPRAVHTNLYPASRHSRSTATAPPEHAPAAQAAGMSSDAGYASFLDKANQDTSSSSPSKPAPASSTKTLSTTSRGHAAPAALQKLDATYTSEADEPFEGVALAWDSSGSLDAASFATLVGVGEEEVEALSVKEWDPRGEYKDVMGKVEGEVEGAVKVFRTGGEGARVEYWVVGKGKGGGTLVGVRAKAVES